MRMQEKVQPSHTTTLITVHPHQSNYYLEKHMMKRRRDALSVVSALHLRSTHPSQSRHFFDLQATYLSRSSLQFNLYPQIVSPHSARITSLDIDNTCEGRFLLAGSQDCTISVYDLSLLGSDYHLNTTSGGREHGNESTSTNVRKKEQEQMWKDKNRFQPVARSQRNLAAEENLDPLYVPPGHSHSVTQVQWYPVDTGVFLSADKCGNIVLWDTNTFTPITCVKKTVMDTSMNMVRPCGIASIDLPKLVNSSHLLLAIGSIQSGNNSSGGRRNVGRAEAGLLGSGQVVIDDRVVYLCDIKSGSMTHQLVGHGMGGIQAVQWSPVHDFVLASGSRDGTIKLWDIRKSGSGACLLTLDRENKTRNEIYFGNLGENGGHGRSKKRRKKSKVIGPSDYSAVECSSYIQSHAGPVASLSFTPDGNYIVSASPSDGLKLWDVQPGNECGKLMDTRFLGPSTSSSQSNQNPVDRMQRTIPLCVTQPGAATGIQPNLKSSTTKSATTVWIGGRHQKLLGYNPHGDGGKPDKVLAGHLDSVTAIVSQHNSMRIFSGGKDGMIIGFGNRNEFEFCQ